MSDFTYDYMNYINSPGQAGSTANGTLTSLGTNKDVLAGYAQALWDGGPNNPVINTSSIPLGNAFFYNTGQTCTIDGTSNTTTRYVYINNKPVGLIGGAVGILPGIVEKMLDFTPLGFFEDLVELGTPTCTQATLEIVDSNGNTSYETNYVAISDVKQIYDCQFESQVNPYGSIPCNEGFTNFKKKKKYNLFTIFILIFIILFILMNI